MMTKTDGEFRERSARGIRRVWGLAAAVGAAAGLLLLLAPNTAEAQIKQPGAHPDYSVELEPHLLLQWDNEPWGRWGGTGWGPGIRASIPFLDNGPIKKINNNMAIGFGLDWAHFSNACWGWYYGYPTGYYAPGFYGAPDCSANHFWFPVVLQWNFFLTDVVSVFGEPGLAIVHERYTYPFLGPPFCPPGVWCEQSDSDTKLYPVFFAGARFLFSDTVGLVVRLGWPYLSIGPTFMI